jgi:ABC-type branched-subunit amino acid transport system ATPase component
MILELTRLTKRYGGLTAVDAVDLAVAEHSVHAIIGPNGSGKTTLFNLISGAVPATSGAITYGGARIERQPAHERARRGIKRTFQNIRLFNELTVLENVLVGQHPIASTGVASLYKRWSAKERTQREMAMELLGSLRLAPLAHRQAGELAYGEKRLVEMARAVASAPRLLLLDEPTSGMNAREADDVVAAVRAIAARKMTILIIEHHLPVVKDLAERVSVLNFGKKVAEDTPAGVLRDPAVVEAYLGAAVDA